MLRSDRWTSVPAVAGTKTEQGHAMIMALIVLALGSMMIPSTLNYMATGARAAAVQRNATDDLYAADAGVEYAMFQIASGDPEGFSTSISVAGKPVNVTMSSLTSLPYGPILSGAGEQSDRLEISETVVDLGGNLFNYTILVRNVGTSTVHLTMIGAGFSKDLDYVPGSSAGVSSDNPNNNNRKLTWPYSSGSFPGSFSSSYQPARLTAGNSVTQTFLLSWNGNINPRWYYSWVVGTPDSIGVVSTGSGYNVVSRSGRTTIEANIFKAAGLVFPISWEIR